MKTLTRFTFAALLVSGVALLVTRLNAAAQTGPKPQEKPKSQQQPPQKTPQEQERDEAARRRATDDARRLLLDCQAKLDKPDLTYQADLREQVNIGGRSFTATGRYTKGRKLRMHLKLDMVFGPRGSRTKAELLQVCDGQILISRQSVGKRQPRVTRRNVQQIRQLAANLERGRQERFFLAIGLGGLPELLASFVRTMVFDEFKTVKVGRDSVWKLDGTWQGEYRDFFLRQGGGTMPAHVPDRVRITIDSAYLLRRVEYVKRLKPGGPLEPMLTLDFKKITLNPKVDDKLFTLPKQTVTRVEVTDQYLRLLQQSTGR